jgi:hypothetical protein
VAIKLVLRAKHEVGGGGGESEGTDDVPVLSAEEPIDPITPIQVEEPGELPAKPKRKKKPDAGTWDL